MKCFSSGGEGLGTARSNGFRMLGVRTAGLII